MLRVNSDFSYEVICNGNIMETKTKLIRIRVDTIVLARNSRKNFSIIVIVVKH